MNDASTVAPYTEDESTSDIGADEESASDVGTEDGSISDSSPEEDSSGDLSATQERLDTLSDLFETSFVESFGNSLGQSLGVALIEPWQNFGDALGQSLVTAAIEPWQNLGDVLGNEVGSAIDTWLVQPIGTEIGAGYNVVFAPLNILSGFVDGLSRGAAQTGQLITGWPALGANLLVSLPATVVALINGQVSQLVSGIGGTAGYSTSLIGAGADISAIASNTLDILIPLPQT